MRKGTANRSGTTSTKSKSRCSREMLDSSTRKLTSHFKALSLNAPWNCVAIRAQKPSSPARGSSAATGLSAVLSAASMNFRSLSCQTASGKPPASFGVRRLAAAFPLAASSPNWFHLREGCPRHGVCAWVLGLGAPGSIFYLGLGFAFSRSVIPLAQRGLCAPRFAGVERSLMDLFPSRQPQMYLRVPYPCFVRVGSDDRRPQTLFSFALRPFHSCPLSPFSPSHCPTPLLYPTPRSCYFQ